MYDPNISSHRKAIALHEARKLVTVHTLERYGTVVATEKSLSPQEIVKAAKLFEEFLSS